MLNPDGGSVLIGTTSTAPANQYSDELIIADGDDVGIQFVGGNATGSYASIYFGDAGNLSRSYLEAQLGGTTSGNFTIGTLGITRFLNNGSERLRIQSDGKVLIGNGGSYSSGAPLHIHGGTTGTQQLRVQNHTAIGSFSGNYGSEFRHAYSSANHCMLIHAQEAADARRTLDISDSNGVFASFTNHLSLIHI